MADSAFVYVAIDVAGKHVRGRLQAPDEAAAFDQLRRAQLSPIRLRVERRRVRTAGGESRLRPADAAEFLASLADLLDAGADIRTALSILASRFERRGTKAFCERLSADIAGGEPLDLAFAKGFSGAQGFVGPMVAAGEAAGDLAGGLRRSAEIIGSRTKLRDQVLTVMAYPAFVFVSAVAAVFVILLFIVPSIAPLAEETGGEPPRSLVILMQASDFLTSQTYGLLAGVVLALLTIIALVRSGLLSRPFERLLLDGPAKRTVGGLVFGAFSLSLGTMLSAGAPISDALRLAIRATPYRGGRRRLEPVIGVVREGRPLADALSEIKSFPPTIIRLTTVGEASNTVGQLLMRAGAMEEARAIKRIELVGRIAGPALIIVLGAILGVLMGGLLSGVSQMGQAALG